MDPEQEFTYTMYCGDGGDGDSDSSSSSTSNADGTDNEESDPGNADTGFGNDDSDGFGAADFGGGVGAGESIGGSGYGGDYGYDDYDVGFDAAAAGFTPTPGEPTITESVTDFISKGGLVGLGVRTAQDLFGSTPNQYAGITGEDGYGEGDYVSTVADYAESKGLTTDYASEDLETQRSIDQQAFNEGFRSQSFKDIFNTGDLSNIQNLSQSESEAIKKTIPQAPFLIGGGTAPKSMVNEYFSNLQNQNQQPQGGILSRYEEAKQNIGGILGTNNQLGASNTSNFYYNYLNQKGLL